ncbi:hypothetical protein NCAS_0E04130 [Naumovozyma castellii]|uniref:Pre-mRNA-splicing factor CWC22 n=1 Tax=Naumovozyma castellii TaxID=27288 RepID=G0VG63_NAUCA|nr:hypothetical protein NCAS_0E04130 [Naumovozyma castellii CBS 4309]CCC70483.1 hypothetical protein NCAS_0E04130 [Naumovozyma castellii CBS 4309]
MAEKQSVVPGEEAQRKNWQLLSSCLERILSSIDASKLEDSFKDVFQVNVILGQNILINKIITLQQSQDKAVVYSALIALITSEVPEIGLEFSKAATIQFIIGYNRSNKRSCFAMINLLCSLFNYEVVHEIVILQLLHLLLQDINTFSISIIVTIMTNCGAQLLTLSRVAHNMIYEKLRELLQSNNLKNDQINESIEALFDLRRLNYKSPRVPKLLTLPEHIIHTHTFMIDELDTTKPNRGDFQFHSDYQELEDCYQNVKDRITLLNKEAEKEKADITQKNVLSDMKDMTATDDLEFKKKIYLLLKSSLSGDEAAHKILKLRIPDDDKWKIVDVIIKSSLQESTYSKFYGLLSERLLTSHKSWRGSFEKNFQSDYENVENWEPSQLRILGKLWGHILATDLISLSVFQIVKLNEDDTNAASRIFLKFILQEYVADLGIDEVKRRFDDVEAQKYMETVFPSENPDWIRYSINYFTAIGLGVLTEKMRLRLNVIQQESMEQGEEEEEDLQEEEQEEVETNEPIPSIRMESSGKMNPNMIPLGDHAKRRRNRSVSPSRRRRNRSRSPLPRRRKRQ